jgi:multimeric flavodoxin WrbA
VYGDLVIIKSLMSHQSLKAIFLLGTLKPVGEFSHTNALSKFVAEHFEAEDVQSEIVHLVEFTIKPGIESDMGEGDDWPKILKKVLASDIVIFATPIWWGIQSSLIQRVIERMDKLNEELLASGKAPLANKVGGMVITGSHDGAEHVIGNFANFMIWNGLTLPPACSVSWLGRAPETEEQLVESFRNNDQSVAGQARAMSRNAAFFARLLKEQPLPRGEKNSQ